MYNEKRDLRDVFEKCESIINNEKAFEGEAEEILLEGLGPLFEEGMLVDLGQSRGMYEFLGARIKLVTEGDITDILLSGLNMLPVILGLEFAKMDREAIVSIIATLCKLIISICQRSCMIKDPIIWKILLVLDESGHASELLTLEQIVEKIDEPKESVESRLEFLEMGLKNSMNKNIKFVEYCCDNGVKKYRKI